MVVVKVTTNPTMILNLRFLKYLGRLNEMAMQ